MEDSSSAIPDWANLPSLAVHLISQKVKCITDYVRFRFVCSSWRAESLAKPLHLPPQLPWLMIPYPIRCTVDDGFRLFYDLWEKKIRKIRLPETIGKACCATYRGWILLVGSGGSELFLLNPLTGSRVNLPPFNIPVKDISDDKLHHKVDYLFNKYEMDTYSITKITLSTHPTDPNCVIMVICRGGLGAQGIFYYKVGDYCWTQVALLLLANVKSFVDAAYNNGTFYLYKEGQITAYNLNQHKVEGTYSFEFEPELKSLTKFFLVGKAGVYMVVVHPTAIEPWARREATDTTGKPPKEKIELYQVIDEEAQMDVKRVDDASDTALFYGKDHRCLAVCTDDWDSIVGGCRYIELVCMYHKNMFKHIDHTHWKKPEPCYAIFCAKMDDGNRGVNGYDTGRVEAFSYPYPLRVDLTHTLPLPVKNLSYPTLPVPVKISG